MTAKKIAKELRCKCKRETLPRKKHFIINYGANYPYANLNAKVNFNKLKQLQKLKENEILVPNVYLKGETIPEEAFPLLARKRFHSQGKDIIYIHNREQLNSIPEYKYDFLVEYINKKSEYRVHVLGENTVIVTVKFNKDGLGDPIIRAKKNGWKQITYEGEHKQELIDISKKVMKILEYDFGAIDIIRKKKKLYVLEANASPGLEQRKRTIYKNYFLEEENKWKIN